MVTLHPYPHIKYAEANAAYASVPVQLAAYLCKLNGYAQLSRLADCDPYDVVHFDVKDCIEMARELDQLSAAVKMRQAPEPPEVGSEDETDEIKDPFGWAGLEEFCASFSAVLRIGIEAESGIEWVGD